MYLSLTPRMIGVSASYEEGAALAAEFGFKGYYVDVAYLMTSGADAVRKLLESHGLRPGVFFFPVNFREGDAIYQKSLEELPEIAEAASRAGCLRTSVHIWSFSDELDFDANFAFHRDRLAPAAKILADHGISLGLEFLGPKSLREGRRYAFVHTIEGMLELCRAVGPNTGLLLDAWHWHTSGSNLEAIRALKAEDVVDVHINDAPAGIPMDELIDTVRCLPGDTGVIDLTGFLQALQAIGYDGPVTVEPFNEELNRLPAREAVERTATAARKVWKAAGLS